jgi:hypothetical protein
MNDVSGESTLGKQVVNSGIQKEIGVDEKGQYALNNVVRAVLARRINIGSSKSVESSSSGKSNK